MQPFWLFALKYAHQEEYVYIVHGLLKNKRLKVFLTFSKCLVFKLADLKLIGRARKIPGVHFGVALPLKRSLDGSWSRTITLDGFRPGLVLPALFLLLLLLRTHSVCVGVWATPWLPFIVATSLKTTLQKNHPGTDSFSDFGLCGFFNVLDRFYFSVKTLFERVA